MRINGRTLRPSTLAERRLLLSLGTDALRVPRSLNPFTVARRLRRVARGESPDQVFVRELVATGNKKPGEIPLPLPDFDRPEPTDSDFVAVVHGRAAEGLGALERALHLAQPGGDTLGLRLAEYGDHLAPLLGVDAGELEALVSLPDESVAPRLKDLLDRRHGARAARHEAAVLEVSLSAAKQLASTAVWKSDAIALDAEVLLGPLLADCSRIDVAFHAAGAFQVQLPRSTLVNLARVLPKPHSGLTAWIDPEGLHLRWRAGRGGLNLVSQPVRARDAVSMLQVTLHPPVVEAPQPTRPVAIPRAPKLPPPAPWTPRPMAPRSRGGWLLDALSDLAILP